MNPDAPIPPRDELEAKLTALLLAELPADEAFALGRALEQDPELAKTFERLRQTILLVKETEAPVAGQVSASTPLKLSEKRREALFQQFKTVKPREFAEPRRKRFRLLEVAAVFVITIGLTAMLLPALSRSKSRAQRSSQASAPAASDGPFSVEKLDELSSVTEADREKLRGNGGEQNARGSMTTKSAFPNDASGPATFTYSTSVSGVTNYSAAPSIVAAYKPKALDDEASKKVTSGPTTYFANSDPRAREVSNAHETAGSGGEPSLQNKSSELALGLSTGMMPSAGAQPQRPSTQIVLPASNEVAQSLDSFALSDAKVPAMSPAISGKDVVTAGGIAERRGFGGSTSRGDTNRLPGDPEWIGTLERPNLALQSDGLQHSGINRFVGRYAGNTFGNNLSVTTNVNGAWSITNSLAGFYDDSSKPGLEPRGDIAELRGLSSNNSTAFSFYSDLYLNGAKEPLDLPAAAAKEPSVDPATGLLLPPGTVAGYGGGSTQNLNLGWNFTTGGSSLAANSAAGATAAPQSSTLSTRSVSGGQGGGGAGATTPAPVATGNLVVTTPPPSAAPTSATPAQSTLAYNAIPSDTKETPAKTPMPGLAKNDGAEGDVNGRLGREESLRRQPSIVLPAAPSTPTVAAGDNLSDIGAGRAYKSETAYRDRSKLAADERKGANLLMEGKGKQSGDKSASEAASAGGTNPMNVYSLHVVGYVNVPTNLILPPSPGPATAQTYAAAAPSDNVRGRDGGIDKQLREQEKRISEAQKKVDQLRESLNGPDAIAFGDGPQMLMTGETLRKLEGLRIENQAHYVKQKTLYDSLTNLPREKLEQVLPTTTQDTALSSLLEQRSSAERKLVELQTNLSASARIPVDPLRTDPELNKTKEQVAYLNGKISNRVDGIMVGVKERVQSLKQGLDQIVAEEEAAKKSDLLTAAKARPYFEARHDLEELRRFNQALTMKYSSENIESSLPKTTMVEIMDDARPATNSASSLWDKLKGKPAQYESKARIKVEREQTDIPFSDQRGAIAQYDPYFVQTEFETIQSDRVLGKVVKDLNLDQKWAKSPGARLSTNEAIAKLKEKLDLRPVRNTSYVEIGVKEDKPSEAADIANAVARSYQDFRKDHRKQLSNAGLVALKEQMVEQEKKIAEAQKTVDELRQKLNVPDALAFGGQPAGVANNKIPEKVQEPSEDKPVAKPASPPPIPQPDMQVAETPFSTFSLNVSDVSFKLAGASLEKGTLPEAAGIRSEEFINAFDYRDPEPPAGVPVAFASERAQYPFAQGRDLLRFSIKTAAQGREAGRPLNLVLLLDNSGSMERADRVRILREALRLLAAQLSQQDKLSVITFARTPHLRVDGVAGTQAAQAVDEVSELTPQGGTNLEEAMNLGYQTALRHYLTNGVNRVVLLTDGAANLGDVEPESLKQKVEANRKQGVALDCFGIGWEGYNDDLLEVLSRNGDGRYGFINSPEEAATEFAGQLAGALHVAASDVKVQVEFNPKRTVAYRQIGYAKHQLTKEQFRDNTVDAAEIGAAEAGNALYVIETNPSGEGPIATVRVRFKVPGTSDYREHEWPVPYTGNAVLLEQAAAAMRLAATASAFSEWLASSPYAGEVTPDQLLQYLSGVPEVYGADGRPKKLEWMIRQAKSLSGK